MVAVTDPERAEYAAFRDALLGPFFRSVPDLLWHYTSGDALVSILKSGALWSTQVSCLNDHSELRYGMRLVRSEFENARSVHASNANVLHLIDQAIAGLADEYSATSEWFVACLSELGDDLSQWRAYGKGEGGYSIGFQSAGLVQVGLSHGNMLVPVNYDRATHVKLAADIAGATIQFYQAGLAANPARSPTKWAEDLLTVLRDQITYFGPIIKDAAFQSEREWRIIRQLRDSDLADLEYRQKRTMLARHLPLKFPPPSLPNSKLLPIAEIVVGPARHQQVSAVSVRDSLKTFRYLVGPQKVRASPIPFQDA